MSKYVELDNEEDEQYSRDGAICPYCGYETDPTGDNYELFDEATDEWTCDMCGKSFIVRVYISYSWTTRKAEK